MNQWPTWLTALLSTLVSALTIAGVFRSVLTRYLDRVFADDVFKAIAAEPARYKDFHEGVFRSELERGRRAADIALEVQREVINVKEELSRFRLSYEGHRELLILIPKSMTTLDESVKGLHHAVSALNLVVGDVREDVAYLKGAK